MIGRKDKHLGPLRNLTDGGEGCFNRVWTDESRLKAKITLSNRTDEDKDKLFNKLSPCKKNTIFIHNSLVRKSIQVFFTEYDDYINQSWKLGRGDYHIHENTSQKMSQWQLGENNPSKKESSKKKIGQTSKDTVFLYNKDLNINTKVKKEYVKDLLLEGWQLGKIPKNNKWMYHPSLHKEDLIAPESIDIKLQEGWLLGREPKRHMYNPVTKVTIKVKLHKVDYYKENGYIIGRQDKKVETLEIKDTKINIENISKERCQEIKNSLNNVIKEERVIIEDFNYHSRPISKNPKGMTHVHNPITKEIKMIWPEDLSLYITKGYKKGRGLEKVWVMNKNLNNTKMIDVKELSEHISKGYTIGRLNRNGNLK